jgi:hypothetical protein
MEILQQAKELYQKTLETYQRGPVPQHCQLDGTWSGNIYTMEDIFNKAESAAHAVAWLNTQPSTSIDFAFDDYNNKYVRELSVEWSLKRNAIAILDDDPIHQESEYVDPRNVVTCNGRRLGPNYLRSWQISREIKRWLTPTRIIELGAGSGHVARSNILHFPKCQYFIVDIPYTLKYSYMHLRLCFPDKKFYWVTCPEDVDYVKIMEADAVFVPSMFTEQLAQLPIGYDLFINTASMGEMLNNVIAYWFDYIQKKIHVKYQYTLNRYLNIIPADGGDDCRLNQNLCSLLYDDHWDVLNWELEPLWTRCPYLDTQHSRYYN